MVPPRSALEPRANAGRHRSAAPSELETWNAGGVASPGQFFRFPSFSLHVATASPNVPRRVVPAQGVRRWRAPLHPRRAKGRGNRIVKRNSHITILVGDGRTG